MNEHHDPLAWARFMEMDCPAAPYDITEPLIREYKGRAEEISRRVQDLQKQVRTLPPPQAKAMAEEVEDLVFQGENIRTMISDIFEKRLGKLMALARDWPHVDMRDHTLLPWEMDFFDKVVTLVEEYRKEGWIE